MISIPEPCHEDFSKMTPTQRGAFCSKCQIDTYDFRNASDQAINKIILKNKGKHLCGQFKNSQLDSLNRGFMIWKNQKKKTFRSKFVLALVMVFGLSLFSCNSQEQKQIMELQAIALFGNPSEKLDYINSIKNEHELDLVDFIELPERIAETVCEVEVPEPLEVDPFLDNFVTAGVPIAPEPQIAGGMIAPNYMDYLEETIDSTEDVSQLPNFDEVDSDVFDAKAFPNPTTSNANLALEIHEKGHFEIKVYDMAGRLVQTVYTGELLVGRQNFSIELAVQNSGMYLVKVVSEKQNETVKIQKLN